MSNVILNEREFWLKKNYKINADISLHIGIPISNILVFVLIKQ